MDATVDTFYKNEWICYQGAYADGIAIKHAMASQKRDSPVTSNKGRSSWPLEADAAVTKWEAIRARLLP